MDLIGQLIQVVSEPPGSFVYHLVTLLALQVVFAISYARWRRDPEDTLSRRMSYAAGIIFLGRLLLLVVGLIYAREPAAAASVLPPLEQAVDTASIALIVWSLVPYSQNRARITDVLLIVTLVVTGVLYLFFAQEWRDQAAAAIWYHDTMQASVWSALQIALLALGLGYLVLRGRERGALPILILGVLLTTHVVHLWSDPELAPTDTNVSYWVRLGYLIALPLWAVFAYVHTTIPLLENEARLQVAWETWGQTLHQSAQVIATPQTQRRLAYSLRLVNETLATPFALIGLFNEPDNNTMTFYTARADQGPGEMRQWQLDLAQHSNLAGLLRQGRSTELLRDGFGSRQLYSFFEAAALEPAQSLLVQPLATPGSRIGVLVVPAPQKEAQWPEEAKGIVAGLSHFVAQALLDSQTAQPVIEPPSSAELEPLPVAMATAVPAAIVIDRVRVQDLEHQLDEAHAALRETEQKRKQAEANAIAAQKQARYLAAALRTLQDSANRGGEVTGEGGTVEESSQQSS